MKESLSSTAAPHPIDLGDLSETAKHAVQFRQEIQRCRPHHHLEQEQFG
jgi:hypothetical protein